MLRTTLLFVIVLTLSACDAAPPLALQSAPVAPTVPAPTAQIIGETEAPILPTGVPAPAPTEAPLAVASPEQKLSPAYQAAPEPMLAATAQILMDTPVLEPTPEPVTVEPAPASPEAVDVIDPAAQAAPAEQPASFEAALVDAPVAPGPRGVVRIVIEAIGLDRVPQEVSTDANGVPFVPKHDVAWFRQSAIPGEGENIVLWGHALRFSDTPEVPAPFGQLSKLVPGDRITLYDAAGGERSYRIAQQVWATPDQVQYILPMGHEQVTLVSCIGDRVVRENGVTMTHRLITIAEPEA